MNKTHNVDAVRRLLGQSSVTATSAYLGVSDNSALELAQVYQHIKVFMWKGINELVSILLLWGFWYLGSLMLMIILKIKFIIENSYLHSLPTPS